LSEEKMKKYLVTIMILAVVLVLPETPEAQQDSVQILARGAPIHGANGLMFDGNDRLYIASVGGREILVMDPDTGQILDRLGLDEGVESPDDLVFGPDGSLYWTALFTGEVGRISPDGVKTGQFVALGVNPITFSDDGRLFVALDFLGDGLYELDPDLVEPPRLIIEELGFLNGFDFGPDGYLYGPIYTQGKVVRIDVDTGEMSTVADGFHVVPAVKFDSQGRLYTGDSDTGEVFRIGLDGQKDVIATGLFGLDNLAFDSNDRLFVSGSDDGYIVEVLADGSNRLVSEGGMIVPQGVTVLDRSDGKSLFVADMMTVRQFDGATGEEQHVYRSSMGGPGLANPVTVTADGDDIVISSWFANMVQVWNPATNEIIEAYDDFAVPLNAIRFQGDLVVTELGTESIVRADGANPTARVTMAEGLAVPADLAADENNLWASDWASGQVLQIVADGQPLAEPMSVATGLSFPEGLAIAADGALLVVESGMGRLSSIDPETGQVRAIAEGLELGAPGPEGMPPTWTFNGVAVDPAGTIYVTGDKTNVLYRSEEPAALPETGGVTLHTYTIILTLATLAILGGLGLALRRRASSH
jgi:sugar lactone lactonase YvrE